GEKGLSEHQRLLNLSTLSVFVVRKWGCPNCPHRKSLMLQNTSLFELEDHEMGSPCSQQKSLVSCRKNSPHGWEMRSRTGDLPGKRSEGGRPPCEKISGR